MLPFPIRTGADKRAAPREGAGLLTNDGPAADLYATSIGMSRRAVLAGAMALAGCQQPGALPNKPPALTEPGLLPVDAVPRLGPDRTGYISIEAPILDRTRDLFVTDVTKLLDQGAAEICVLMNSPGGVVRVAQDLIAFIEGGAGRGIRFTTHNTGVVASAACYVFLAGQRRIAVPRGTFLFHEASVVTNGAITSQNLQDASTRMQQLERTLLAMLVKRTRLTQAEAASFIRRTVILNATEAQRDGVIDTIADFRLPQGATISRIRVRPGTPPRATG